MRLRTFTAPDIPAALGLVRESLGESAVILSTREHVNGRRSVSITAAVDAEQAGAPKAMPGIVSLASHRQPPQTDALRFEIQNILRFHNLPELLVAKLMKEATDTLLASAEALHRLSGNKNVRHLHRLAVEKILAAFFSFDPLDFDAPSFRIMLVGTPGAGKTLTIAKMAARIAMDGQPLTVITTDNKRAGGVEQLEAFTRILKIDLKVGTSREELAQHLKQASARVLVDTAGCNPYDREECEELQAYAAMENIEPVLALSAGGDPAEAIDTVEAFAVLPIKRLLVTRTDTARRFGSVLTVAATHRLALCNASHSPGIIDPLESIDAALMAKLLLHYQLKSSI